MPMSPDPRQRWARIALIAMTFACAESTGPQPQVDGQKPIRPNPAEAVITVNTAVSHQTIVGWEGAAQIGQEIGVPMRTELPSYGPKVVDSLVNALGITSIRVHLPAGVENNADYFKTALDTDTKWIWVFNLARPRPTGQYYFSGLDEDFRWVVTPMVNLIRANGETPNIRLVFHGNNDNPDPGTYSVSASADGRQRGANSILAAYRHMWGRYGLIPDEVDVVNEPNLSKWTPDELADFAYRIGKTLQDNASQFGRGAGWQPVLTAPGTSVISATGSYFDVMWNYDPTGGRLYPLRAWIRNIGYHIYDSGRPNWDYAQVESRRAAHGLRSYMTEYTGLTYTIVHDQLKNTNASLVDRLALAFPSKGERLDKGDYFLIADGTGALPKGSVYWSGTGKLLRNYFRYIRPGAVRKGTQHSNSGSADGLAFRNPDGRYVVVVKTTAAGPFWVDGLPGGTYGINYGLGTDADLRSTTNYTVVQEWNRDLPDVTVDTGSAIRLVAAGAGAYTIYQK